MKMDRLPCLCWCRIFLRLMERKRDDCAPSSRFNSLSLRVSFSYYFFFHVIDLFPYIYIYRTGIHEYTKNRLWYCVFFQIRFPDDYISRPHRACCRTSKVESVRKRRKNMWLNQIKIWEGGTPLGRKREKETAELSWWKSGACGTHCCVRTSFPPITDRRLQARRPAFSINGCCILLSISSVWTGPPPPAG